MTVWSGGTHPSISEQKTPRFPQIGEINQTVYLAGFRRLRRLIGSGDVSRGDTMLYSETDPESHVTDYT